MMTLVLWVIGTWTSLSLVVGIGWSVALGRHRSVGRRPARAGGELETIDARIFEFDDVR